MSSYVALKAWCRRRQRPYSRASVTIGDTFGSGQALFTRFALVGLVYTALLPPRRQKRIRAKEQDSQRQSRFAITWRARLNAHVALLKHAKASIISTTCSVRSRSYRPVRIRTPDYRSTPRQRCSEVRNFKQAHFHFLIGSNKPSVLMEDWGVELGEGKLSGPSHSQTIFANWSLVGASRRRFSVLPRRPSADIVSNARWAC